MVYKYRKVKCPHCGKTSDSSVRKDYQELTGSPFRVCPNCKKTYFDSGYQEPALLKYNDTGIEINFWSVIGAGIFTALAVYMITEIVKGSDSSTIMYVVAGIFAFLALVLISGIVRTIIHLFRKEEYHLAQVE